MKAANWGALMLSAMLVACGTVSETRSARQIQADEEGRRAASAFERGEYPAALAWFKKSLEDNRLIENTDGIAINLLNLARTSRALGNAQDAQHYLDMLLNDTALDFQREYLAQGAMQAALLRLGENKPDAASAWADKAEAYCGTGCMLNGTLYNLRASIAIAQNDADSALGWCSKGLSENKASKMEYANSLRLAGQAHAMKQEYAVAQPLLDEALVLDKALGLPEKIKLDLTALAKIYEGLEQPGNAAKYRERAMRIGTAESNNEGVKKP